MLELNSTEVEPIYIMENQEIWKDIIGYEGLYQVSNLGRVKSLYNVVIKSNGFLYTNKEKILKLYEDNGYYRVSLCKNGNSKKRKVHQLVAENFLNHKPCGHKLVVNHINLNKKDNTLYNLEIITNRENCNKKHIKSSSIYTGVYWHKGANKWCAQIQINGKIKYLGLFKNEKDAGISYENELNKTPKV